LGFFWESATVDRDQLEMVTDSEQASVFFWGVFLGIAELDLGERMVLFFGVAPGIILRVFVFITTMGWILLLQRFAVRKAPFLEWRDFPIPPVLG